MLKQFRFSNVASFRDEAVLSMEATGLKDLESVPREDGRYRLLPAAAIYGKNGGGKSNVLLAFGLAVSFILNAQRTQHENAPVPVMPFLLDDVSAELPSSFEFEYEMEGIWYKYGFSATKKEIISEYLYHAPKGKNALVFSRDHQTFRFTTEKKKRNVIAELITTNQLFFPIASNTNDADCKRAMRWFREYLRNGYHLRFDSQLEEIADNRDIQDIISEYIRSADVGIGGMEIESRDVEEEDLEAPEEILINGHRMSEAEQTAMKGLLTTLFHVPQKLYRARFQHFGIDKDGVPKSFVLFGGMESQGTRRLVALLPEIVRTLNCGGVLVIDELENGLHPELVALVISKFQSRTSNPKGAQLIFSTQNTELLNMELLRKDQIYLADKDQKSGASSLYSVSDFSTRTHEDIHKSYLAGKFGAVPDITLEEVE